MFDATIERENAHRLNFEEFLMREAMNVIACEGAERVQRPESYKQWQVRISQAGFKLQPLNQELVLKLRSKRVGYHKDFVFDENVKSKLASVWIADVKTAVKSGLAVVGIADVLMSCCLGIKLQ
ncbi:hypothetical protein L1987_64002 [Smallanthus sonchifolius]|uniref:Uncharacterized protein n=1 Tax=Smallanthus sonchifolius TaxID=185202 RepID=A0ACB9CET6_9ASTR|nr:hypothetical protein L1987_64002 [Smallanthus sonchifolius]